MDTFCRFDPVEHAYYDRAGARVQSITQMLMRVGLVDGRWYGEESSERGTRVHELATDYDLGALDLERCVSAFRPWVCGYAAAMKRLRPTWEPDGIEHPSIHPAHRFAGRPDRVGRVFQARAIVEIKTNNKSWNVEAATPIQTALQAILVSARYPLPAEHWARYAIYIRPDGKFRIESHQDTRDFDRAYEIIRQCCS